jgi:hypothetical protein
MIIAKLEGYALAIAAACLCTVAAYFYGRFEERSTIATEEHAADEKALQGLLDAANARAADDARAHAASEAFIARVQSGLGEVNAKFSSIPNVVVDARGCGVLSDGFRLRWAADNAAGAGPALIGASDAHEPVPAEPPAGPAR